MVKWLRKYQTYILVVGGCLLMVAFLLGSTLQELTQRGFIGGKALKVDGRTITNETFAKYSREHFFLSKLISPQAVQALGAGDTDAHWVMLVDQAEKGGYVGGLEDGNKFIAAFALAEATRFARFANQDPKTLAMELELRLTQNFPNALQEARLTPDEGNRALARLRGIVRMRNVYLSSARFSDKRMTLGGKSLQDSADVELVEIPADQFINTIPDPDDAALKAHFDRFRDTLKGTGDLGVGYRLPPRIKLEWLELDRAAITTAITVDPVKVQEAYLRKFPTGKAPEGINVADIKTQIENDVRKQQADRIMKSAAEAVQAEIAKSVGKLERVNEYRVLPADWASKRPQMSQIAPLIVARVQQDTGMTIPQPRVTMRDTRWLEQSDLSLLPGVGSATLRRNQITDTDRFPGFVMGVRELADAGRGQNLLQTAIPAAEPLQDAAGNLYFVTVLDARKESPADSLAEVREDAVRDYKILAAYDQLKPKLDQYRRQAATEGLDAVARAAAPAAGTSLPVSKATVNNTMVGSMTMTSTTAIDTEPFRKAVLEASGKLNPKVDPKTQPAAERTVAQSIDASRRLVVAQVVTVKPMTQELFRAVQPQLNNRLASQELTAANNPSNDPYSLKSLEKRLNVEYITVRPNTEASSESAAAN